MSFDLEEFINPEQLLDFGFELLTDNEESEIAHEIIGWYAIQSDPTVLESEERLEQEVELLITRGILRDFVELGLMTFDFETDEFSLTRFGKRIQRELRAEAKRG